MSALNWGLLPPESESSDRLDLKHKAIAIIQAERDLEKARTDNGRLTALESRISALEIQIQFLMKGGH
jgi:hypothetical protein